jgi:hypothetical protein
MGIPDEINPEKMIKKGPQKPQQEEGAGEPLFPEAGEPTPPVETQTVTDEDVKKNRPLALLKRIGIELTEDDFSRLLFKGYVEKTVTVCVDPASKKPFTALFRSITGEEYDEADELLSEELKTVEMTRGGLENRRSMWVLSYGCTKLDGRDIIKPVMKGDKLDSKETAKARKKALGRMSPTVLNKMMRMYGVFTMALDLIIEDPEKAFLDGP